jgi:hypothetical protein
MSSFMMQACTVTSGIAAVAAAAAKAPRSGSTEPSKPKGGEDEEAADERRASAPDFDNGLEIAGPGQEIGDLCHLDHEEGVVKTVVAHPDRIDLCPFITNRAQG